MNEDRYAILIGSTKFPSEPKLPPLRCPENDVCGLDEILSSPTLGPFETTVLLNQPHHQVLRKLNQTLKQAKKTDLIFIYYSGHGKLDLAGRLYLTTIDTEIDALEATSIPIGSIRNYIDISPSQKIIIILDCCYSGAAGKEFFPKGTVDEQLQEVLNTRGTYILTASTGIQVAQEKEGEQYSLMTKYLLEGISDGRADTNHDGLISVDDLYDYTYAQMRKESFQTPMKWGLNLQGGDLILARTGVSKIKEIRKFLISLDDQLPPQLLSQALALCTADTDTKFDTGDPLKDLLDQLFNRKITVGEFVEKWYKNEFVASHSTLVELAKEIDLKPPPVKHSTEVSTAPDTYASVSELIGGPRPAVDSAKSPPSKRFVKIRSLWKSSPLLVRRLLIIFAPLFLIIVLDLIRSLVLYLF